MNTLPEVTLPHVIQARGLRKAYRNSVALVDFGLKSMAARAFNVKLKDGTTPNMGAALNSDSEETMLGYGGGESITVPVSIKTMESSTPYMCAAIVFGLVLLYTLFIAVLMLFLNLAAGNMAGVIGAFAVSLYGLLLNPDVFRKLFHFTESQEYRANVFCGWLSPLNQATFPMHSFGYDYLPGIGMSMFIFAILIIALIGLSAVRIKGYNFSFTQTNE